jgi:hypothetical protein
VDPVLGSFASASEEASASVGAFASVEEVPVLPYPFVEVVDSSVEVESFFFGSLYLLLLLVPFKINKVIKID